MHDTKELWNALKKIQCNRCRQWTAYHGKFHGYNTVDGHSVVNQPHEIQCFLMILRSWRVCNEDITTFNTTPTIIESITRSRANKISNHMITNLSLSYDFDDIDVFSSWLLLTKLRFHVEGSQQSLISWKKSCRDKFWVKLMLLALAYDFLLFHPHSRRATWQWDIN